MRNRLAKLLIVLLSLFVSDQIVYSQTLNDGPIQLKIRVRDVNTTFTSSSDGSIAGVGFLPDDYTYKVWARDNTGLGPAGWQGGNCLQSNFNPPGPSIDFNTQLFSFTYPGVTVPQFFDIRLDAWEDDLPTDGALGICTSGKSRCNFDCCNECCGFGLFGACVGVREEDDRHCDSNPFRTNVNYRLGNPCQWYDHGYLNRNTSSGASDCNNYHPKIESFWRYIRGDDCSTPIDLGTLSAGGTITHINSNECYNNTWTASPGNDVFYQFSITQPLGVRVSLCGGATWNTNLYLLDGSCNQLYFNNNGSTCSPQSEILESLCTPGNYIVVVDGHTAIEQGVFTLTIAEDPSVGLNVNINSTNVSCNGLSDGSATASASGGTPPYTYSWSPGGSSSPSISGLAANTYTVQVTDDQGCMITETVDITEPAPLAVSATGTDPVCFGGNSGEINITSTSGGTAPYEYSIGGAFQPSTTFTGVSSGTYTVTVRDDNLCQATTTATLNDPPQIQVNAASTPESCTGFADGTITPNPSNGTGPYQCAIGFPPVYAPCGTFGNLGAGNYVISVKDANGCEATENVNINLIPALTISLVSKTNVSCNGLSDGEFEINATGGTPPVNFSIDGGVNFQLSPVFTGLVANNYTVLAQDANGCTNSLNIQIDEPSVLIPSVLFQIPITCNGLSDASIVITASGGTGPYLYSMDSVNFFQSGFFTNLSGGSFDFYIVDDNDCPATLTANTIEPDPLDVTVVSSTPASCSGINNGVLTLDGIGGTPPYKYSLNNGPLQTNATFNNLAPGDYLIGIEDNNGCVASDSTSVTANVSISSNVSVTNVLCKGDNTGEINITGVGGTAPYDYSIDGIAFQASGNFTGLSAGNYNTIARDASGCTALQVVAVQEPAELTATVDSITDATCPNISDGAIFVTTSGGVTPYSYNWTGGLATEDISNVSGGNYTLTVTDDNGCTFSLSATIDQPNAAYTDITNIEDVTCFGLSDGYVDVDITGGVPPFSYDWSDGSTNQDLINVTADIYYLTVTDARSCEVYDTAVVSEPTLITASINATGVSCASSADADIDLTVSGGTAPYRYFWSNFVFTEDQTDVPAGNYTVLITDDNGCEHSESVTINPAPGLEDSLIVADVTCFGEDDGRAEIQISGGTPPYNYSWSNGGTNNVIADLAPGIYEVTVTDSLSCSGIFSTLVDEPQELKANVSATDVLCFGDNDGLAIPFVTGGTGEYSFLWNTNPPETNPALADLSAGTYVLEVRDENNCLATDTAVIDQPSELTVAASAAGTTCFSGEDGEVTIQAAGGVAPYQYSVTANLFQDDSVFRGLEAGDYGVMVIDANGCMETNQFTVIEPENFSVTLDPFMFVSFAATEEIVPVIHSQEPIMSYEWTPSDFLSCTDCQVPEVTGTEDRTYTLAVTDSNGCVVTAQITVVVKDEYEIFVPNAFSPNGDEVNDIFKPLDFGSTQTILIQIFNRWGALIYQSEDIDQGWDGRFQGKALQPGIYVYKISGEFLDGEEFDKVGSVALLK